MPKPFASFQKGETNEKGRQVDQLGSLKHVTARKLLWLLLRCTLAPTCKSDLSDSTHKASVAAAHAERLDDHTTFRLLWLLSAHSRWRQGSSPLPLALSWAQEHAIPTLFRYKRLRSAKALFKTRILIGRPSSWLEPQANCPRL